MKTLSEQLAEKMQARGYRQVRPVHTRSGLTAIEIEKRDLIALFDEELIDLRQDVATCNNHLGFVVDSMSDIRRISRKTESRDLQILFDNLLTNMKELDESTLPISRAAHLLMRSSLVPKA